MFVLLLQLEARYDTFGYLAGVDGGFSALGCGLAGLAFSLLSEHAAGWGMGGGDALLFLVLILSSAATALPTSCTTGFAMGADFAVVGLAKGFVLVGWYAKFMTSSKN